MTEHEKGYLTALEDTKHWIDELLATVNDPEEKYPDLFYHALRRVKIHLERLRDNPNWREC